MQPRTKHSPRVYLSSPHMGGEELRYVQEAFETNWIAPLGPNVDAFEKEVCDYLGIGAGLALSSGTAALHLGLRLLGVGRGDEVFCSALTFVGSANPILYEGAVPVFIDSEPTSWNMSATALTRALEKAAQERRLPKAVMIVNLYGQSADMDALIPICERYQVPVIEDAAESFGAWYGGKKSGTFGRFSILSFNGNKIITTGGGGMLLSEDRKAIEKARFWSTQARDPAPHYQHSELGFNYRMSNILAGIGRGQLRCLDRHVDIRRGISERYAAGLADVEGVHLMPEASFGRATRWLNVMTIDPQTGVRPIQVIQALAEINIEARPVWKPLHRQPLFEGTKYFEHLPGISFSDRAFAEGLCLPSGSTLSEEDQTEIIRTVRAVIQKG